MFIFSLLKCVSDKIPTGEEQNEIHSKENKNKLLIMIILKPSIASNIKGKSIVCLNTYNGFVLNIK